MDKNSLFQLDTRSEDWRKNYEQDQLREKQNRGAGWYRSSLETEEGNRLRSEKRAVQLKEAEERTVYCKALDEKIRKGMGQQSSLRFLV
ncbi:MAG: hypothetical protein ACLVG5_02690 [Clostridium sp.]